MIKFVKMFVKVVLNLNILQTYFYILTDGYTRIKNTKQDSFSLNLKISSLIWNAFSKNKHIINIKIFTMILVIRQ